MTRNRINGTTAYLEAAGVDYAPEDITSYELGNDDAASGTLTFGDAKKGGSKDYTITWNAVQSLDGDSFQTFCWDNVGLQVQVRLAPKGNAVPTVNEPHYVMLAEVPAARPTIGGEAAIDADDFTFESEWKVIGEPVRDDGSNGAAKVSAATPSGRAAGQLISLIGTRFAGATAVKFGNTASDSFVVNSDANLTVKIPTGVSTGNSTITVITPEGTSAGFTYSVA